MKPPKFIDIELNTSCNLNCKFCPYHEDHKHPKYMKLELYQEIIDQISWNPSIKLCQRGEPLLSPILLDAIKYAHDKGLKTVINTNGLLLNGRYIRLLMEVGLTTIILSDYGLPKQYFKGVLFSSTNRQLGYPIYFIVKSDNEEWRGICDKLISPVFYDYKNKSQNPKYTKSRAKCEQLFERLIIEPDGKVRCCCGAIHEQKYVGDITLQSILDIWTSPLLKYYRTLHRYGKARELEMCRECAYFNRHLKKT